MIDLNLCGEVAWGDEHLPPSIGEMTVTLDNVSSLLQLPF